MIPLQHPWQNHNGAAHRKKIDTPSLGGSCSQALAFTVVNLFAERGLHHLRSLR